MKEIIDISSYQGKIDFEQLKNEIAGVIIRCGYTGYGKSKSKVEDAYFEKNYKEAIKAGLLVGVYYYSCATSINEAQREADFVLDLIQGKMLKLGVWFDTEDNHDINKYAPQSQASIGKSALTNIAKHFLMEIKNSGFKVGIYASTYWLNNHLDMKQLSDFRMWVAQYANSYTFQGKVDLWQYTDKGKMNGIDGNVDKSKVINEDLLKEGGEKMNYTLLEESIIYYGVKVYIVRFKGDVRLTVSGNSWDSPNSLMLAKDMSDKKLESEGYEELSTINGGLFYPYGNTHYANGIERIKGITNQDWDTEYDENMAVGFRADGSIDFDKQKVIKNRLNEYYGALTFAFGIMKDSKRCTWGQNCTQYKQISGRSILGQNENEIILVSFPGVTGKSGLYGSQLYALCEKIGMKESGCLDGGGSVYLSVNHQIRIASQRKIKNTIKVMTKKSEDNKEDQEVKTIHVSKVGMRLRKTLSFKNGRASGEIERTIPAKQSITFDRLTPIPYIQADGYQWFKGELNGATYYCQYDSTCYWVE